MVDRNILLELLPPFKNEKNLLVEDQVTFDIINEILKAHRIYASDYDKISSLFWQGDPVSTAEYIFDFAKRNIKYDIELSTRQTVKSPSAIIATGIYPTGLNDCKHYSQFIAGILDSLRRMGCDDINWNYRFVNYRIFETDPQHVFVVLKYNGSEYWVDPVFASFNERNSYVGKIDKKVNMSLYSLAGHKRKIGAVSSNAVSIPPDIARGAYLIMLSKNVMGSAYSLFRLIQKNPIDVQNWWQNVGGDFADLKKIAVLCYNIPQASYVSNAILAAATPMLSEISILSPADENAQSAFQAAHNCLQQFYNNSKSTIGDLVTDAEDVSQLIPGVGNTISEGIKIVASLFGSSSQGSTTDWVAAGAADLKNRYTQGLTSFYTDWCGRTFRLATDYNSVLISTGVAAPGGGTTYADSGLKLTTDFPTANVKDLFNFVLANWPQGIHGSSTADYNATWNIPYVQFMKNYVATNATGVPVAAPTTSSPNMNYTAAATTAATANNNSFSLTSLLTPTNLLIAAGVYLVAKHHK